MHPLASGPPAKSSFSDLTDTLNVCPSTDTFSNTTNTTTIFNSFKPVYKIGAWNVNGWSSFYHPENSIFKTNVINNIKFDVLFISETFCKRNDTFTINNYKVIQFNRQLISHRSVRGSGGCAIALSNDLLSNHVIVATYRGRQDGILAVKLRCTENNATVGLLSNYLPPDSFHYGKDPEGFYQDNSLVFSDLLDCDLVVAGGDINSRTKEELDFIPDIDANVLPRSNPDTEKNNHGKHFLQFLKDNRALILNGRVSPENNDFTFISPRGRSVPDYMYCPADHIKYCTDFDVLSVSDVINIYNLPLPRSLPDHSILVSNFDISVDFPVSDVRPNQPAVEKEKSKKNVRKIGDSFLSSQSNLNAIHATIERLESQILNQTEVDNIYTDIKTLFQNEINTLPNTTSFKNKHDRRVLRKSVEFWNPELQCLWETRCKSEKVYRSFYCDGKSASSRLTKQNLHNDFKSSQLEFDRIFRRTKRQFENRGFHNLAELAENASSNPDEMWKRLKALSDKTSSHVLLEIIRDDGSFSKNIQDVLSKWHDDFSSCFKGIKDDPNIVFDDQFLERISRLKSDFEKLSPEQQVGGSSVDSSSLNSDITLKEVSNAIDKSKLGKAFLCIPNEAMKNNNAKLLLHKLFNVCFKFGLSPSDWLESDLKPLFKGGDKNPRNPLDHRPLCIMSCVAKVYSAVLNARLQTHLETNGLLSDTQNGFRSGRSCLDHIFSLVTILRNRKLQNQQTFLCFIDFRRAFDSVNHVLLFNILSSQFGVVGKMYFSLVSLYRNPTTRVVLTSPSDTYKTQYFKCPQGVKQGDILSPTLFSIFVHNLTVDLENCGVGVSLDLPPPPEPILPSQHQPDGPLLVNHLIYADDLVCIASNENDLQFLINVVYNWCCKFRLEANLLKTEILHVRKCQAHCSKFVFKFGSQVLSYCKNYKYLGLLIDQFLNFEKMSNSFFDKANRALNAVICKMIKNKGFPFSIYEMLYNCCVTTISDYAHEVIGFHQYSDSAKLHSRAIRGYLGVGHSAPLCGIRSEMSWPEPRSRTQTRMLRYYLKVKDMNDNRLTKKIFLYDQYFAELNPTMACWSNEVKTIIQRNNLSTSLGRFNDKHIISFLSKSLLDKDIDMFRKECKNSPKLTFYNTLFCPFTSHACTVQYTRLSLPFIVRKRLAQIRLGVLPIRIESDRYNRIKTPAHLRFCIQPNCSNKNVAVEDEMHFICTCSHYTNLRTELYSKIEMPNFNNFNNNEKFRYMLTAPNIARNVGQFIIDAFDSRLKHGDHH